MGHQHAVLWRDAGLEAAPARRHRGCQMHGGAVDASGWIAGHQARQGHADNGGWRQVALSGGSCAAPVPCRPSKSAVSVGLHVRVDLAGLAVCGLRDRRFCPANRRLAMKADFVLDALEQALYARQPHCTGGLIHHSDRSSQYVSIRYTERLAEAGIEPSVGSKGDSYDNALAGANFHQ